MKLLIYGDSFAVDGCLTWANLLAANYEVINCAQAGSSEYRIYQNVLQYKNFSSNRIIVCHTSPYRIYSEKKWFSYSTGYHDHCDLIYNDVKNKNDDNSKNIAWWFENVFNLEQAKLYHYLLINHIIETLPKNSIHITFFDTNFTKIDNFSNIWKQHSSTSVINHLNLEGNVLIFNFLQDMLKEQDFQ